MSHVFCINHFTCDHFDADEENDESSALYASDINQMSIAFCHCNQIVKLQSNFIIHLERFGGKQFNIS